MNTPHLTLEARDTLGAIRITVRIRMTRRMRLRCYLGGLIIKFGGWVAGFAHTTVVLTHE